MQSLTLLLVPYKHKSIKLKHKTYKKIKRPQLAPLRKDCATFSYTPPTKCHTTECAPHIVFYAATVLLSQTSFLGGKNISAFCMSSKRTGKC